MSGMQLSEWFAGTLAAFALAIVLAAGCTTVSAHAIRAALGENFKLRVGQSALLGAKDLEIGFEGINTDSRCAKGETCIWEGDAVVRVWMQQGRNSRETLELHTASSEPGAAIFGTFSVQLVSLDPLPVAGRSIAISDYIATLKVTAGDAASEALSLRLE